MAPRPRDVDVVGASAGGVIDLGRRYRCRVGYAWSVRARWQIPEQAAEVPRQRVAGRAG